jgi:hypothetical protein
MPESVSTWTEDELTRAGRADELLISSTRPDGTDRPFVTIWAVRSGDGIYVRSAHGSGNPWFRMAVRSGTGRIRAGGVDRAVVFTRTDPHDNSTNEALDAEYHAKYDRYPAAYVTPVVGSSAHEATLRIDPR